jgi:hypothetical protein
MSSEEWQKAINNITDGWTTSPFGSFAETVSELKLEPEPPTWKDRISKIPYLIAYYTSYPFIWLICELWHGVKDAWESVFDE